MAINLDKIILYNPVKSSTRALLEPKRRNPQVKNAWPKSDNVSQQGSTLDKDRSFVSGFMSLPRADNAIMLNDVRSLEVASTPDYAPVLQAHELPAIEMIEIPSELGDRKLSLSSSEAAIGGKTSETPYSLHRFNLAGLDVFDNSNGAEYNADGFTGSGDYIDRYETFPTVETRVSSACVGTEPNHDAYKDYGNESNYCSASISVNDLLSVTNFKSCKGLAERPASMHLTSGISQGQSILSHPYLQRLMVKNRQSSRHTRVWW